MRATGVIDRPLENIHFTTPIFWLAYTGTVLRTYLDVDDREFLFGNGPFYLAHLFAYCCIDTMHAKNVPGCVSPSPMLSVILIQSCNRKVATSNARNSMSMLSLFLPEISSTSKSSSSTFVLNTFLMGSVVVIVPLVFPPKLS
jgi:hypothetical protein